MDHLPCRLFHGRLRRPKPATPSTSSAPLSFLFCFFFYLDSRIVPTFRLTDTFFYFSRCCCCCCFTIYWNIFHVRYRRITDSVRRPAGRFCLCGGRGSSTGPTAFPRAGRSHFEKKNRTENETKSKTKTKINPAPKVLARARFLLLPSSTRRSGR